MEDSSMQTHFLVTGGGGQLRGLTGREQTSFAQSRTAAKSDRVPIPSASHHPEVPMKNLAATVTLFIHGGEVYLLPAPLIKHIVLLEVFSEGTNDFIHCVHENLETGRKYSQICRFI